MIVIILFYNKYTFNNRMKQIFDIFYNIICILKKNI